MQMMIKSAPLRGVLWMGLFTLAMVGVNGVVKHLGPVLPASQSAFIRFAISALFLLPMIRPILKTSYSARVWRLFGLRGACHIVAVLLWFYAMARVPVAEMSAIGFLNPVLVLVIGGLLLGEGLSGRRIFVALAALLGALIVLRPGLREVSLGHWAQLGATFGFALAYFCVKLMSREVAASTIVAMMTFSVTLGLAPLAILAWVPVTLVQVLWLGVAAGFATLGHYAMTRAFTAAPLAVTQPVGFLQVIWAAMLGWFAFGEAIDPYVIFGGAVIICAISLNTWIETRRVDPQA